MIISGQTTLDELERALSNRKRLYLRVHLDASPGSIEWAAQVNVPRDTHLDRVVGRGNSIATAIASLIAQIDGASER